MVEQPTDFTPENGQQQSKESLDDNLEVRLSRILAPHNASETDLEWIQTNIQTIQQGVRNGSHDVLYYPACGRDFLRVMLAYDVTQLITVDSNPELRSEIKTQLSDLEIPFEVSDESDTTIRVAFNLDGKQRSINHFKGDARKLTIDTMGKEKVDIVHIYLPTGADKEIRADEVYLKEKYGDDWFLKQHDPKALDLMRNDPKAPRPNENGEYEVIDQAVPTKLDSSVYQRVNEGGFFVFNEKRIIDSQIFPSLYKIAGLKELEITRRQPLTILTSMYPSPEDLIKMDKTGFIYQKETEVNPEIINIFSEIVMTNFWTQYSFIEFDQGNFGYMGIEDDEPIDVISALQSKYQELKQATVEFAQRFEQAGVSSEDTRFFQEEILADFRRSVSYRQQNAGKLLQKYQEVGEKYKAGQIDKENIKQELGIVTNPIPYSLSPYINEKYPLAAQLVTGTKDKRSQVKQILDQLASKKINLN